MSYRTREEQGAIADYMPALTRRVSKAAAQLRDGASWERAADTGGLTAKDMRMLILWADWILGK